MAKEHFTIEAIVAIDSMEKMCGILPRSDSACLSEGRRTGILVFFFLEKTDLIQKCTVLWRKEGDCC